MIQSCSAETDRNGRETAAHGTVLLPAACYDDDIAGQPLPWHWHDELEAGVVTEGTVLLSAGMEQLTLPAGDGFFLNAGVLHSARSADGTACRMHAVVFHPRLVGGSMESAFWQTYLLPLLNSPALGAVPLRRTAAWEADALRCVAEAWRAEQEERPGHEFALRGALSSLVFELYRRIPAGGSVLPKKLLNEDERLKRMLRYLQEHFAEELTLEKIAASASVSKSECLRCFQSIVRTPPLRFLMQYRLQRAAELLNDPRLKIIDAAEACGFHDMSYFAKAFRRCKGMTPGEYQKSRAAAQPPGGAEKPADFDRNPPATDGREHIGSGPV